MTDQAENLRRLVRAQRDWKKMAGDDPPGRAAAAAAAAVAPWDRLRNAGALLGLGGGRGAGPGRKPS